MDESLQEMVRLSIEDSERWRGAGGCSPPDSDQRERRENRLPTIRELPREESLVSSGGIYSPPSRER